MFTFSATHLRRLCALNAFPIPDDTLIFFGLRGCLPADTGNQSFASEHSLLPTTLNYQNPRCTIGQWRPATDEIAVFPGSTIPSENHLLKTDPNEFNQLIPGAYDGWKKGWHNSGQPSGHQAFRIDGRLPVLRTFDNRNFDGSDRIFTNKAPNDNIHAAFCSTTAQKYDSAGCQVVVGRPAIQGVRLSDTGPWKVFRQNGYETDQENFAYLLFRAPQALSVAQSDGSLLSVVLRYGSKGELVEQLQQKLNEQGSQLSTDGDFGFNTLDAVIAFQTTHFGAVAADGVVGKFTREALGLEEASV